jgi:hypothetical protein
VITATAPPDGQPTLLPWAASGDPTIPLLHGAGSWTGPVFLRLRNGRDWAAGTLEVTVGIDRIEVQLHGRSIAVLDRGVLRDWFLHPDAPLAADDTRWTFEVGDTILSIGFSRFTVTAESLTELLQVI